jgi:hypothetical protein
LEICSVLDFENGSRYPRITSGLPTPDPDKAHIRRSLWSKRPPRAITKTTYNSISTWNDRHRLDTATDKPSPWPLPKRPWIMEQGWYRLLFAHWPLAVPRLLTLVPDELETDTFDGEAWVSLTPFEVRVRPRGFFSVCKLWSFPELNCRTYVRYGGIPGIYFFSLDARSLLAALGHEPSIVCPTFTPTWKWTH